MKWKIVLLLIISFGFIQGNFAQKQNKKIKISGVVTDSNMRPVRGAFIIVDGVKKKSVTDSKGFYRVKVSSSAKEISVIPPQAGIRTLEINNKTVLNFILDGVVVKPVIKAGGEEEMINIGYGKVRRKDLTSEVGKIEGQQSKYHSYSNIFEMIKGEVPGVDVVGNSINIRNSFSFQLSTEPLFVVDGVIVPGIDGISPMDVRSIVILKGSSASVYGARGANGVLLITTINSKEDK